MPRFGLCGVFCIFVVLACLPLNVFGARVDEDFFNPKPRAAPAQRPRLPFLPLEVNDAVWATQRKIEQRAKGSQNVTEVLLYGQFFVVQQLQDGLFVARSGKHESLPSLYAFAYLAAQLINNGIITPNKIGIGAGEVKGLQSVPSGVSVASEWAASKSVLNNKGSVRTFLRYDQTTQIPQTLGVLFSDSAIGVMNTDATTAESWTLATPATLALTPYKAIEVEWWPSGVKPTVYDGKRQIAITFYLSTEAQRSAISVSADECKMPSATTGAAGNHPCRCWINCTLAVASCTTPPSAAQPANYTTIVWSNDVGVPLCAPRKGLSMYDKNSPELVAQTNGAMLYKNTFVYGYWNGELAFVEAKITVDWLQRRLPDCRTLRLPSQLPRAGYYPTLYCLMFDPAAQSLVVTLGRFEKKL